MNNVLENELEYYETEEELTNSEMFSLFSSENQFEILENWKQIQ